MRHEALSLERDTGLRVEVALGLIIHSQINSPGRDVAEKHGSESSIHAPKAFFPPNGLGRASYTMVGGAG